MQANAGNELKNAGNVLTLALAKVSHLSTHPGSHLDLTWLDIPLTLSLLFGMNTSFNQPVNALKMHVRNTGKISLPFADLMFLQATGNYSWLHWKDGQRMLLPRTLKYYEPQLPIGLFARAHRSCIINIHYIERMVPTHPDRGGVIYLRSGDVLPVSRRRWATIRKIYQSLPTTDRYTLTGTA